MRIRLRAHELWFATLVILLMLVGLIYSYPSGLKDVAELSERAISYFQQ